MFPRPSFVFLLCLVMATAFSEGKDDNSSHQRASRSKLPIQSFVVNNNCGLAKTDREMIAYIKAKVDYISAQAGKVSACSTGWVSYGKSCYLVIDIPTLKWSDARRNCQKMGADLAKITSAGENRFLLDLISKQKKQTRLGAWLGLHRKNDTKFYWADDTPLAGYSPWATGEPNNPSLEKCGNMYGPLNPGEKGKWNDATCTIADKHIALAPVPLCQKDCKERSRLLQPVDVKV